MNTATAIAPQPANSKRVLAWLDNHAKSILVLHAARRRAKELNCAWSVAYVETPQRFPMMEDDLSQHMLRLCTLAEQMGAEVLHLRADNVQKGIDALLEGERDRIALFIVGGSNGGRLRKFRLRATPWEYAVRQAGDFARVEVVPLASLAPVGRIYWNWRNLKIHPMRFVYALAAVSIAFAAAKILEWTLPPALFRINMQNVSLLFMTACAFVAGRYGLLAGVAAAAASFLTYNYFYMAPYGAFKVTTVTHLLNMGIFLGAGILIALFTSRVRTYGENIAKRERMTQALFTLYRIASTAFSREQVLETLQRKLSQMLDLEVAFFLPSAADAGHIELVMPAQLDMDAADKRALMSCWSEMKTTGTASPLHSHASWRFEPMVASGGEIGVFAVRPKSGKGFDVWQGALLSNIADQTAVLLEHIDMERTMEANRLGEEREKLRSMLLSSVSHDLKTPLAGIIGGLSVYLSVGDRLTKDKRQELVESAFEEAQRLDSFITNILDMTRLESGRIDFRPEWHDMADVITQAAKRVQNRLHRRKLVVHPLPAAEVYMDAMMIGQVLQNLIDNACKYTPDGTQIEISCQIDPDKGFLCRVRDHGAGIPTDKLGRVFDKYARLQKEDSQVAGTGLGLAICKAIIEAQQGWIMAANHPHGGAEFTFCLPEWKEVNPKPGREEVSYVAR